MPDTRRPLVRAVSLVAAVGLMLAAASPALTQGAASRGAAVVLPPRHGHRMARARARRVLPGRLADRPDEAESVPSGSNGTTV